VTVTPIVPHPDGRTCGECPSVASLPVPGCTYRYWYCDRFSTPALPARLRFEPGDGFVRLRVCRDVV